MSLVWVHETLPECAHNFKKLPNSCQTMVEGSGAHQAAVPPGEEAAAAQVLREQRARHVHQARHLAACARQSTNR